MLQLYRAPFSTNVERVALALAYKGLTVESVTIDYADRSPVEAVSGQPLVPVLVDDGVVIADSALILDHLERKYPDPDRFDIRRKPSDHLAFGRGEHVCIGMNLARIQMRALFEALIPRVQRFELLEHEVALNNTLRGFGTLKVRVS